MNISEIKLDFYMHMNRGHRGHIMAYQNKQFGIRKFVKAASIKEGPGDSYFVIDGDDRQYRDVSEFKAALKAIYPELED